MKTDLTDKIHQLFEYRQLPWMLDQTSLKEDEKQVLYLKLVNLQREIFLFDNLLETQWQPDTNKFDELWANIELTLKSLGNYGDKKVDFLLSELRTYTENEYKMRNGEKLTDLNIKTFYYFKSCDVRLMRNIILEHVEGDDLPFGLRGRDWRFFDYITEVNDDISDLKEDLTTYNGNRWLQALTYFGQNRAAEQYRLFLDMCGIENRVLLKDHPESMIPIWTKHALEDTLQLLMETLSQKDISNLVHQASIIERIN